MIIVRDRDDDRVGYNGEDDWESQDDLARAVRSEFDENGSVSMAYLPHRIISGIDGHEVTLTEITVEDVVELFKR